jgi:hypothetical protein
MRHPWLYALPQGEMPPTVQSAGRRFAHVRTFKHDFFAATGLYRGPEGLVVLKCGRQTNLGGVPLDWIGSLLTGREARLYRQLQGTPGIPRYVGMVGGRAFLHEFVPGHPLQRNEPVCDAFFPRLERLLAALHERHIAYVDLNKQENILVGDDGRPYLIDFQISLHLPPHRWWRAAPMRWLLQRFQQADRYHLLKHKRRLRPDLLTPAERERAKRLSIWIRLHRLIARPLTNMRRRLLRRLRGSQSADVAGSSAK